MKTKFLILVLGAALILTACASPAGAATSAAGTGPTATPGVLSESYPNALPVNSQLALGTIKLKDTPDAVTPEQAASLLPLWEALRTLSTSTSASPIEVNALVAQIQETMKPSQLQTIAGFNLTNADTMAVLQGLGGGNGFGGGQANGTRVARTPGANNNNRGGGNFNGPPDGGGGPGGGGIIIGGGPGGGAAGGNGAATVSPSIQATARAQAAQRFQVGNTQFFNAVVVYLQQLAPK